MAHAGGVQRTIHQVEFHWPAMTADVEVGSWVAEVLADAGLHVGVPVEDDDVTLVEVHGPGRVIVGCYAFDGTGDASCAVEDVPKRLRRPDPAAAELVTEIVAGIDAALRAQAAVRDVTWTQGGPPDGPTA
jgi:hypothetical protein